MERVEDSKALQTWKPLSGIFNRETVADFIALSEEIAYFIGVECFLKAFEQ